MNLKPTLGSGKICYIEIPATDVQRSADFYHRVFGWPIRNRDDGSIAFDDAVGQVSGTWKLGRKPNTEPGVMIYIRVANASVACAGVVAAGGEITKPVDPNAAEITAWFRDPAGNVLSIYQEQDAAGIEERAHADR